MLCTICPVCYVGIDHTIYRRFIVTQAGNYLMFCTFEILGKYLIFCCFEIPVKCHDEIIFWTQWWNLVGRNLVDLGKLALAGRFKSIGKVQGRRERRWKVWILPTTRRRTDLRETFILQATCLARPNLLALTGFLGPQPAHSWIGVTTAAVISASCFWTSCDSPIRGCFTRNPTGLATTEKQCQCGMIWASGWAAGAVSA